MTVRKRKMISFDAGKGSFLLLEKSDYDAILFLHEGLET